VKSILHRPGYQAPSQNRTIVSSSSLYFCVKPEMHYVVCFVESEVPKLGRE